MELKNMVNFNDLYFFTSLILSRILSRATEEMETISWK